VTPKTVYLEPLWNLHAFQHQMLTYPPRGYAFVTDRRAPHAVVRAATRWHPTRTMLKGTDTLIPTTLAKAWVAQWKSPPPGTTLTYAIDHVVFRREPWIVEVEYAGALIGVRPQHFGRFRRVVHRLLASPHCRRIVCWSEAGRRSLADLGWERIEEKSDVVYYAVPPKSVVWHPHPGPVKLLFVGSGTSGGAFEGRGSEIFEVFAALRKRHQDLEFVVRSDVPAYVKEQYSGLPGLRIIDRRVPREILEREFQSADIFLFPSYYTLPTTILEAMSFELPVVTIDSWANAEYIDDGKTGLVSHHPGRIPRYYANTRQPIIIDPQFANLVRAPDREVVDELASRVSLLIENPELRRRMGIAGRWEVEHGRFSLGRMNDKLRHIFDGAIQGYQVAG
jgi:glycosyltransferase involved in cell wall biosynthesis